MPKTSFTPKFTYQCLKMSSVGDRHRECPAGRVGWKLCRGNSTCSFFSRYVYLINQVGPAVGQAVRSAFSLSVTMATRDGERCPASNSIAYVC